MKKRKGFLVAVGVVVATVVGAQSNDVPQETVKALGAMAQKGIETFEWGFLVESEGFYGKTGSEQFSDLVLATVEFTMDATVNEWLSGHVGLLWEEDDTEENNLDEGFIIVGGGEAFSTYAVAGRFYLPFGNFESAFVSDPLTLELAEINQSSVMAGYDAEWFGLSAGAFKGGNEDVIENGYAAVHATLPDTLDIGAYWLSDLSETASQFDVSEGLGLNEKNGGAGAYANLYLGPVTVNAEFVSGLEKYATGATPMAYNLEASFNFFEKWLAGIKFEKSEDLYFWDSEALTTVKYHEKGYGAVVSYGFNDHAALSAEYLRLEKLDNDEDGHLVTLQLTFEI